MLSYRVTKGSIGFLACIAERSRDVVIGCDVDAAGLPSSKTLLCNIGTDVRIVLRRSKPTEGVGVAGQTRTMLSHGRWVVKVFKSFGQEVFLLLRKQHLFDEACSKQGLIA